jgi:hypothetical protein
MTADELLAGLKKTGTGEAKLKAAREFMREQEHDHASFDGEELLEAMAQRATSGEPFPWPEGTQAKARELLAGRAVEPGQAVTMLEEEAPGVDKAPHTHAPRGDAPEAKPRKKYGRKDSVLPPAQEVPGGTPGREAYPEPKPDANEGAKKDAFPDDPFGEQE